MLFEKDSRQDDQCSQDASSCRDKTSEMKSPVPENGDAAGYGIKNVDTGKYIGGCIYFVKISYHLYKYAVAWKGRAKLLPIREY